MCVHRINLTLTQNKYKIVESDFFSSVTVEGQNTEGLSED